MNRAHLIAMAIHAPAELGKLLRRDAGGPATVSETPRSQAELLAMIEKARN